MIRVKNLQLLLSDVLKNANYKIRSLEGEKKKVEEKFIGLLFNMEDCKIATLEAQKAFNKVESKVKHLRRVCMILKSCVRVDYFFFMIRLVLLSSNVACSLNSFCF